MNQPTYKIVRDAIDASLLRRELAEAVEDGWLSEEEANAIRRLKVPSGERRRRLKKARNLAVAQVLKVLPEQIRCEIFATAQRVGRGWK